MFDMKTLRFFHDEDDDDGGDKRHHDHGHLHQSSLYKLNVNQNILW